MSKTTKKIEKPLTERIAKARSEQRTQQALELTKQLAKSEPSEAHQELLRQVTLERGEQLQANRMTKEAHVVFTHLLTMGGTNEFRARVIERLAGAGGSATALAYIQEVDDPEARKRITAQAVDAAVALGATGKSQLQPDLHPAFDLIFEASAHAESGRDDAARTALQAIGLQSPFLEWKLLLRGLLAYYNSDDDRARENWQRLDPGRLPYRVIAPLRSSIDPAFLKAQTPAVQKTLAARAQTQQGQGLAHGLREVQRLLQKQDLAGAFRLAAAPVQQLRLHHPDLAARLGQCFFWAIVDHGEPDDLGRYIQTFGTASEDPLAFRLKAMTMECHGFDSHAHLCWQKFIEQVANHPEAWPTGSADLVRAMIWTHMAVNAVPGKKGREHPFRDAMDDETLDPDAETCLRNAIALAPNRLIGHVALFQMLIAQGEAVKARKAGRELLTRFPGHAPTYGAMGTLHLAVEEYQKAQQYFEKALHANPLDRSLRGQLARARRNWALQLLLEGKTDTARVQIELALKMTDGSKSAVLCQWAVAEIKGKNPERAEELIAQAKAEPDHRLASLFALVGESVRAKLSPKDKKRFTSDLKTALAEEPSPGEILVLLESAVQQRDVYSAAFHGQKTQEKSMLKFLEKLSFDSFSETQLERVCASLQALDARKPWLAGVQFARKRFLKNPIFRLSWADYYLSDRNPRKKTHMADQHLEAARRLIDAMPRGEQQQQLLEQLVAKEKRLNELRPSHGGLLSIFENMFGGGIGSFEDDDDEDDEFYF